MPNNPRCPRCKWRMPMDDKLCLICRTEDKMRAENHPVMRGKDHDKEFENCYLHAAGPFQLH